MSVLGESPKKNYSSLACAFVPKAINAAQSKQVIILMIEILNEEYVLMIW